MRRGAASDTEWLVEQLKAFSDFFGSKIPLFDEAHTRKNLPNLMKHHVLLVADETEVFGQRHGFIAGQLAVHPFNPAIKQLNELFWWVTPEHRMSSAGARLLKEFIQIGEDIPVNWITMALEEQSPVREESLLKKGFRRTERSYLLEVA